jgi:hypothetical protein
MKELASVETVAYPQVYMQYLQVIYHYNVDDIQIELSKQPMDTLYIIHKLLCEETVRLFPEFNGRRIINRQAIRTIVCDITNMDLYIVNKLVNRKEMDKIFLETINDNVLNPCTLCDMYDQFVEILTRSLGCPNECIFVCETWFKPNDSDEFLLSAEVPC